MWHLLRCSVKYRFCENAFPQVSHLYDCSPVWVLSWSFKQYFNLYVLPHVAHLNGLSPVCIFS